MKHEKNEYAYWSKEVSENLGIADSTLRKWCRILENKGHIFLKDSQDRRAFTEQDLILLRRFKELTVDKKISLDTAANIVLSRENANTVQTIPTSDTTEQERYIMRHNKELIEFIEQQKKFNEALIERIDEQQKYIEEMLKKRDEQLILSIRAIQDNKKSWWKKLIQKIKGL